MENPYRNLYPKQNWPKAGDKLTPKAELPKFVYPHFISIVEDAHENLKPDTVYTVRKCEVYSSWCAVWLEEFEGDRKFHLSFFDWNYG